MTRTCFTLRTNDLDIPLRITEDALAEYREHGLTAMDECLDRLALNHGGVDRVDLVGEMMLDGLNEDNTRKLTLCALWMAHHHPGIAGLERTVHGAKMIYDLPGNTFVTAPRAHPTA